MTAIRQKSYITISLVINVLMIHLVSSQRPSFAGSRPTNGLNQKDKYHTTPTAPLSTDIANRFGEPGAPVVPATPISNQIPFGQTQKPPVGIVVTPESTYVTLPAAGNAVTFEDRFGEADVNTSNTATATATASNSPTVPQAPIYPLDAHGDQQLIDQLSQLPRDKQPFWFINYQAIEAQRNGTTTNSAGAQAQRGSFFG